MKEKKPRRKTMKIAEGKNKFKKIIMNFCTTLEVYKK